MLKKKKKAKKAIINIINIMKYLAFIMSIGLFPKYALDIEHWL